MLGSSLAYVFFAFLTLPLLWIPVPSHLRAKNAGLLIIVIWTTIGNVTGAAAALSLMDTYKKIDISWGDFAAAIQYLWGLGTTTGWLILIRRLALIVSPGPEMNSIGWNSFAIELLLGLVTPLVQVPLHYIVQGHRYNQIQDVGCVVAIYPSVPAIILVLCYPVLINIISFVYAVVALYYLCKRKHAITEILQSKEVKLTRSQFFKLIGLGVTDISLWLPLSVVFLGINIANSPVLSYTSWKFVHSEFRQIGFYIFDELSHTDQVAIELSRWMGPLTSLTCFAFFGFNSETRMMMINAWNRMFYQKKTNSLSNHQFIKESPLIAPSLEMDVEDGLHCETRDSSFATHDLACVDEKEVMP